MMNCKRCVIGGFFLVLFLFAVNLASGQVVYEPTTKKKEAPPPRNLKVLNEEPDGKGNIVRIIQYDQGSMRVTETIIMPKRPPAYVVNKIKLNPDTINKDSMLIVVDKSKYSVNVFYKKKMIRAYKATFGPKPLQDKCMEGDRCTPEGWFRISRLNPNSKYHKFLQIDYPTTETRERFNRLKKEGIIPASARIGGDIGIHGIWKGGDDMIELGVGWTDGCVALKNTDIEDLFSIVGVGTRVYIRK